MLWSGALISQHSNYIVLAVVTNDRQKGMGVKCKHNKSTRKRILFMENILQRKKHLRFAAVFSQKNLKRYHNILGKTLT